jgi:ABC-type taurine transport system substrate-binding protein
MRRAGVTNAEFKSAARYLDEQGLIADGHDDYETFVVTSEGVERVA